MIFPSKHLKLSESFFGLGSYVLENISSPKTIDEVWESFLKVNNTSKFPAYHSFDNLILTVDFLYSLGLIEHDEKGKLKRATN